MDKKTFDRKLAQEIEATRLGPLDGEAARRAAHDKAHPTLQSEIAKELAPPSQRYKPGEGIDLSTCYHMGPAAAEFTRQVLLNVATAPGTSPYPGSPLRLILDDMSAYLKKAGRL